ncbi:MAG: lasso peptide biosynthesis B2 protein [Thermoleophilaceae bacterium]|nr:lasso peptide biosynthesis B2 protein [Thermoleophilaceae bacterium]
MDSSSSGRPDWRAFRALRAPERRSLAATAILLPASGLLLRLVGYRRLERMLARVVPLREGHPDGDRARASATSRMVAIGASRSPFPSTCLSRSLTLWLLLRAQRIESEVCLGVRRKGSALDAHAWVSHLGMPLNDGPDVDERFATVHPRPPRA